MADNFADLIKTNRQASLEKLSKQLGDATTSGSKFNKEPEDPRLWYPAVDKAGNGSALVRFLPPSKGEDSPFVRRFHHSFQGPGGLYYSENCLTTIGKSDPCADLNNQLWNSGDENNKKIASTQKRKLNFFSNIYIIKDPLNPENEGQVRIYRYGKKIFDKINAAANPKYEDDTAVDVFDLIEGANLRMVITTGQWRSYEESTFAAPSPLFKGDDGEPDVQRMEAVWDKEYPLQPFVAADQFKDYATLKEQLDKVLGLSVSGKSGDDDVPFDVPVKDETRSEKAPALSLVSSDEDETINFFDDLQSRE